MTFTEFQATRKPADTAAMQAAGNEEATNHGLLYTGGLWIESTEGWGQEIEAQGRWHLIIERDEWISNNLEELERLLYVWGIEAGNLQASCALCRALIQSGEGLFIDGTHFCSEACHQEAEASK